MTADFIRLLCLLADENVKFVLVGGLAAASYGSPQVTQDVDICVSLESDNLRRLKSTLHPLHPLHRMHPSKPEFNEEGTRLESMRNIYLNTDLGQLDCLGEIKGIGNFHSVLKRSRPVEINGRQINILNLDALIESKQSLGRPKDKEAVLILNAIMEKKEAK